MKMHVDSKLNKI